MVIDCDSRAIATEYGSSSVPSRLVAAPVSSPYGVAAIRVGSYFRFRVVFQTEPRDQAGVHIYTYADREEGLVPLHQADYAYPLAAGGAHGFTGLQFVYEPLRDGEFQYWCEMLNTSPRGPRP